MFVIQSNIICRGLCFLAISVCRRDFLSSLSGLDLSTGTPFCTFLVCFLCGIVFSFAFA